VGDAVRQLRALERAAAEAQRTLEAAIARADDNWHDHARRAFEADHLAAIRSDARLLCVELGAVTDAAEQAARALRD
jgi:hypothetical protein